MNIKLALSLFAIIGFIVLELGNKTTVADSAPDLIKLAAVLEAESVSFKEWSVYSREYIEVSNSPGELEEYAKGLQDMFPDWDWSISTKGHTWEVAAVSPPSVYGQEYLQLISTRTPQESNAYIIYKVTGGKWNEESAAFLQSKKFSARINDIFRGKPSIFSCIEGKFNDRIDKAVPGKVTSILERLNAAETEALREDDFISVSAFSPNLPDTFGNGMNVQIAARSTGGKDATVIIGTPIITVEY
ncbi:hypothetical protein AM500_02120 [Bacillus sp. FJAT-18017]|uniref:YwmB family TATA-box binding protein n=1 Tax=Bacillus sp. FJAT-18017 TaxID=1705566 RepID=UPI0006AF088E|nr:YwmB family TATA-box binding protein [Bacillus sp. FJAT-18017]ALC88731.1 hypothetical protein AM500_02120 [Bacillus sp. FJAT-18017]